MWERELRKHGGTGQAPFHTQTVMSSLGLRPSLVRGYAPVLSLMNLMMPSAVRGPLKASPSVEPWGNHLSVGKPVTPYFSPTLRSASAFTLATTTGSLHTRGEEEVYEVRRWRVTRGKRGRAYVALKVSPTISYSGARLLQ